MTRLSPAGSALASSSSTNLWDGTGAGSCWTGNRYETTLNLDLLGGEGPTELPACEGHPRGTERPEFPGGA